MGGHAHHLVGDAVRLMLQRIIDRADLELRLDRSVEDCVHSGVRANRLRGRNGRGNSWDAGSMRAHGSPLHEWIGLVFMSGTSLIQPSTR